MKIESKLLILKTLEETKMENKQLITKYAGFKDYDSYKTHIIREQLKREIFENKELLEEQRG